MQLLNALQEILTTFSILPEFEYLKLSPCENSCHIYSNSMSNVNPKKFGYVFIGQLHEKIDGLDEIIGIDDAHLLQSIINAPGFINSSAVAVFVKSTKHSSAYIHFQNNAGHNYKLPLRDESHIDKKIPPFSDTLDLPIGVKFTPDTDGIYLFKYWQKKVSVYQRECYVKFYIKSNKIHCQYKLSPSQIVSFPFKNGVGGSLTSEYEYRQSLLASILSLYPISKVFNIEISDMGHIRISITTVSANYNFYVSAQKK